MLLAAMSGTEETSMEISAEQHKRMAEVMRERAMALPEGSLEQKRWLMCAQMAEVLARKAEIYGQHHTDASSAAA